MLEWLSLYRADAQYIASFALGLAVLRFGAGPERAAGLVFVGLLIVPAMLTRLTGQDIALLFGNLAWLYTLFDIVAAAAFIAIALKANRSYTLWLAGFQLVALSAHVVRGLVDAVSPLAYAILAIGPSYGQLLVLAGGLLFHCLRLRRYGPYRDWRPRTPATGRIWSAGNSAGPHG
ncbi:hypothetical protein [Erythrobacter cryptus]|uniref:hypothetical protein n=1 Tax=Erythrobacter cryptus TaxID=196588 RepID=UPI0004005EB3|nr:hypothetical protein [Erythrobacter cryptus]